LSVRRDVLLNALLKHNYFPMQKKRKEELPPVFTSSDISKDIAQEIRNLTVSGDRKKAGFDAVQYRVTRFNNVPRVFSIPHPRAYVDLCFQIYDDWAKIKHICSNDNSLVIPRTHRDKRTIIVDYESSSEKRSKYYKSAFGKKFLAHADITNCFPGLYSHSIPWALVGVSAAKKKQGPAEWFNRIDKAVRWCSRNETTGVPIGPATSNVVSEIVLERVDTRLRQDFKYVRYIDDYTAYCGTHAEAEEFIRRLAIELMTYKLNLNIKKTEIVRLPQATNVGWVGKMREVIPQDKTIGASKVSDILDAAVRLQEDNPDGSILKYAATSIVKKLDDKSSIEFAKYVMELCFHYPVLIPLLDKPLSTVYKKGSCDFESELRFLLKDSINQGRSDAACWLLYYLKVCHGDITATIAKEVVKWGDCMALSVLAEFPSHRQKVVDFAKGLNKQDLYELDTYWILLYQLFLKNTIGNPYSNDDTFETLKNHNVSLVRF
jgi:hypothetical protein